ncbi:uncharacterized protein LOC120193638 [Hibiscus syriacus]|uniref:uncharacterized protein LOC120193638 n=1 Tax=Hibiscus syriacus TaxID=106335 RepID=UPI001924F44A|nr:uncharacterized protein LOC120193638 [Hibiscus syriacus]
MKDFQDLTHELDLLDHPFFGPSFTWSNKQTDLFLARKLDRVLINPYWFTAFPLSFVEFLSPGVSDHCMAIVNLAKESHLNRPKPFKFFNFWSDHPSFLNVVRNSWLPFSSGNPMSVLFTKLKRLKSALKQFNNENFNNLPSKVKAKKAELELQQLRTLKGKDGIEKEIILQDELKTLEEAEILFLKHKEKIKWIKNGDKNTKFFHSMLAFKNKRDTIRVLIDGNGNRLESFDAISKEVTSSFSKLLGSVDNRVKNIDHSSLKELLNYSLPSDAAFVLVMDITNKAIQEAFFSQGNDKAPGPDGYSPCFFKKAWSIVGDDVLAAVKYFFHNNYMNPSFNSTIIALVPKVPNPKAVKDFRPISFITWIETCFTQARYSISFNGSLIGYFKGTRGLRQGDPLSPTLFVLAMHVLSKMLNLAAAKGVFGYHPKCKRIGLTHLSFADDLMIFCKGSADSIMGVLSVLDLFYEISGLQLNSSKCEIFSVGSSSRSMEFFQQITGFKRGSLPVRYLGIPLVTRKLTEKDCVVLIEKIKQRLHHWPARNLSYAGRLELIRDDKPASGARVSWDFICFSKVEGGLGIKNTEIWNQACSIDLIRKILEGDGSLWVAWLKSYVFKDQDFWNFVAGFNVSWSVNRILKLRSITLTILSSSGYLRLNDIWKSICIKREKVPWQNLIWFPMHIPKFSLIAWMSLLNRLPTRDRLLKIGISTDGTYVNCSNDQETRNHLFCQCSLVVRLWSSVLMLNGLKNASSTWEEMVTRASSTWKGKSLLITILKIAWTAYIYTLWEERNRRIFQGRHRSTDELLKIIIEAVRIQLKGKNINRADRTNSNLCIAWGIT